MARARVGAVELEYEVRGTGVPLVLVMGIGAQLVFWEDELVERFVARGFQVIRFDHRDIGLSTRLDHLPVPRPGRTVLRALARLSVDAPYTLSDMAGDVIGLLDHLGIDRAHVVGVSMGGMIAQHLAIEHPRRIHSLTSVMSTPGKLRLTWSDPRALVALFGPAPRTAEQAEDNIVKTFRVIGGAQPADEERLRRTARRAFERGLSPRGFLRHFAAIAASGDRTGRLGKVRTPALIIHGADDPLIRPAAGRATARAIPGARYVEVAGMAHFMPRRLWDELVDRISSHAQAA